MNTTIKRMLHACLFASVIVLSSLHAQAFPLREFYKMPVKDQGNTCIRTTNSIRDRLSSEFDAKGNRKAPNVLRAQREYADFIRALFDVRDEEGDRINYIHLYKFVYSEYILNPDGHLEAAILKFTRKALDEKIAADKARASTTR